MGVLAFFHSFGFTGSIWLPLITGFDVVYHPNPMDGGTIGEIVQKYRATLIISTPSFCAGYARKCSVEQFATLRCAVVGAEKLREPIARWLSRWLPRKQATGVTISCRCFSRLKKRGR